MATAYSAQTKAAVIAALSTGGSVRGTAKAHGVSETTVRAWRAEAGLQPSPIGPQKKADLGEQLYGYLEDSIGALRSQLAVFGDADWLKKQSAGELAILHGVVADKTARLLAAVRPSEPEGAIEGSVSDGNGDRDKL